MKETGINEKWRIYVINLKDATKRRKHMLKQLNAFGLTATFFDAIDGRNGLPQKYVDLIDKEKTHARVGRHLTDGEFACALSHREIYQLIINEKLPGAIILEDDAVLSQDFADFYENEGYTLGELIQMDHLDARVVQKNKIKFSKNITLFYLAQNASLTTGYTISANAARHIILNSTPLAGLADWPCNLTSISPLATMPRIIDHPEEGSDSFLSTYRDEVKRLTSDNKSRYLRFFRIEYWKRWIFKRITRKIS